jgi:hypothetical protein
MQKKQSSHFKMKRLFLIKVPTEAVVSSANAFYFLAFNAFSAASQSLS